ncbi:hypothetical protein PENCOP_c015G07905 [Penicillium coprophilum]|uniref:Major facilitator superfamily (MFS) profile domain-containing protein n=1 Tax=Penicillium coprophilum TaxID=36646 RepID=A0A1V6U8H8_9EURO|nr:hypothetical protein PENCOP_c015G07905 [Penicillium coprophilum]
MVESNESPASEKVSTTVQGLDYPSGIRLAVIIVALVLTMFMVALDMTIVATAIPRITDEFHSLDQVGWYGSAFFLTLATFQSTWGKLYKFWDLKFAFLAAGALFEIGSLICGVAPNSTALIVGRAIAGWGAAGLVGGCYTVIAFVAPPSKAPRYTGLIGTSYATASVAGPLLGGAFTDGATWRWCFYINLPIGGISLAILAFFFRPPSHARPVAAPLREKLQQLDLIGAALTIGALVCFLLVMQWGGITMPWNSANVIGLLVGFGLLTLALVASQFLQGERAALAPRLIRPRVIYGVCVFVFFQSGANFLFTYYLPIYFQAIDGMSAAASGIRNLPFIVLSAIFAAIAGIAITRVGYFTAFLALGSAVFLIGSGLIYTLDVGSSASKYLGYQVLLGLGQGLAIQIPVIVGQAFSMMDDIASVTAIVLFFQMMGGAVFISAAESVFSNRLLPALAVYAPTVDAARVLSIGATGLRSEFSTGALPGILQAYMVALQDVFLFGTVTAACAFVASWLAPFRSILHGNRGSTAMIAA